jgi:hypothetical protein
MTLLKTTAEDVQSADAKFASDQVPTLMQEHTIVVIKVSSPRFQPNSGRYKLSK